MKAAIIIACAALVYLVSCSRLNSDVSDGLLVNRCGACHGLPPDDNVHSIHVTTAEFHCSVCHSGYGLSPLRVNEATHDNGMVDVVFTIGSGSENKGTYNAGDRTCQQVYCHGNFPGGKATASLSINDELPGTCTKCHLSVSQMASNDHHGHSGAVIVNKCENCHTGYSVNLALTNKELHINGAIDSTDDLACAQCH